MKKVFKKIFGGLNLTWPKLIIFSIIMGIYTALMAMLVPDGNSFHDIAVTPEWWVLPAIIIIVNSKKPLEAALKTFVFFLISQPLVYLIQVPFNQMGWNIFSFYPYWFKITLLTFPGAFIGWFIKKDKWYSGIILALVTAFLAITGVSYIFSFIENPPSHLVSIIYCFASIIIYIFAIFKDKIPRLITAVITAIAIGVYVFFAQTQPFETYNNTFINENEITFVGEPYISSWGGNGEGGVEIIKYEGGYNFKLSGARGKSYQFSVSDDENEYNFKYYYDDELQTVVIEKQ
ncbi:MAG: hypothetical protein Q4A70_00080 [Candidatus Saccharibacteria bacterium]|nr:hypothetical protein [Candidatus Saccharibacteria bacterium]